MNYDYLIIMSLCYLYLFIQILLLGLQRYEKYLVYANNYDFLYFKNSS